MALVVLFGSLVLLGVLRGSDSKLQIGSRAYSLEIADSQDERIAGLSNRDNLASDAGMLFVFEESGVYRFWMKDTRIPLDMIWLNGFGDVIYIEPNVLPETFPQSFGPDEASLYVIELNAGQVEQNGLIVGDQVDIDSFLGGDQDG